MKYEITGDETPFNDFFKIRKLRLKFERFDGSISPEVTRFSFEKSDAIACLLYHQELDSYILVKQFRIPLISHGVEPWMTEIVAGGITPGENEFDAAHREVIEETGYSLLKLEKISFFYVSPGILNERVHLFLGTVDEGSRKNEGGGLKSEEEDIELIFVPRQQVMQWIADQSIGDAKTIIALQWHAMQMA